MTVDNTASETVEPSGVYLPGEQTPMEADAARRLTERIRIAAANYTEAKAKVLELVDRAKAGQAHVALGYKSWTAYLSDVLSDEPLRLAREERRELVTKLADEGLTTRAIAPVVGVSHQTVANDLEAESTVKNLTVEADPKPEPVVRETTGLDGKVRVSATAGQVRKPKRTPLPDQARSAGWDLDKAVGRLQRIADDDRFPANKEAVAPHLRSHLTNAIEACKDLLDRIDNH